MLRRGFMLVKSSGGRWRLPDFGGTGGMCARLGEVRRGRRQLQEARGLGWLPFIGARAGACRGTHAKEGGGARSAVKALVWDGLERAEAGWQLGR